MNFDDGRHDFDFLHGRWQVRNERLRERLVGSDDWEAFDGTQECRPVLAGLGNIDELRSDWEGGFAGLTLRLFNPATRAWSIRWASSRTGVLEPPVTGRFADGVGLFDGEDTHAGRPVRVRFRWERLGAHVAHWQQAFSIDDGRSWETNWHMWLRRLDEGDRLVHEDAVIELRQYTLHSPDARDTLVDLFERELLEPQHAVGMHVIGQFRDLDAPDRFVWLRGFPSMPARREALQAFYFGPAWRRHREAANATMVDSDNVLLLRPVASPTGMATPPRQRPAVGTAAPAAAFCLGICALAEPGEAGFAARFARELAPLLQQAGANVVASFITDASENTFPQLPVREGERVLVWLARFDDVAALDEHLAVLREHAQWNEAIATARRAGLMRPPELRRLVPTPRSELR